MNHCAHVDKHRIIALKLWDARVSLLDVRKVTRIPFIHLDFIPIQYFQSPLGRPMANMFCFSGSKIRVQYVVAYLIV